MEFPRLDSLKNQLIVIIMLALLLPSAAMLYDIFYATKTDDVLIAETEKKLVQITDLVNKNINSQLLVEDQPHSSTVLNETFNLVAEPLTANNYPGVRLCLYIIETGQITIHGYLHEYGQRLPEEKEERDLRIYNEAKEGILAVEASGTPITRIGKTWDDQFLEHLVPVKLNGHTVAILWAEERMHPIFAKSQHIRLAMRYVIFLVFGLGISVTLMAMVNVMKRIRSIKDGLKNLENNLNDTLPEQPGELGVISKAINKMARNIAEKEQLIKHYQRQDDLLAMGRLTTEIAHELRAPVSIIQATAEAMESNVEEVSQVGEYIRRIERQVERHNQLINELLEFGRPNPGAMKDINIAEMIEGTLFSVKPLLIKHGIELEYLKTLPEPVFVDANEDKLKQVFINLIVNAIESMQKNGQLTVQLNLECDFVIIMIKDTGQGISQEDLQRIFEPFYTRKSGGSGLGLAISKRIIEIHGGIITVQSERQRGSIFTVLLPVLGNNNSVPQD